MPDLSPHVPSDSKQRAPEVEDNFCGFAAFAGDLLDSYAAACKAKDKPAQAAAEADAKDKPVQAASEAEEKSYSQSSTAKVRLKEAGIDPTKVSVTIGICELGGKGVDKHAKAVENMANGKQDGVCPGAKTEIIRTDPVNHKLSDFNNSPNGLDKFIEARAADQLNNMCERIKRHCLGNKDPAMRVFNASIGTSRSEIFDNILSEFEKDPKAFNDMIVALTGPKEAKLWADAIKYNRPLLQAHLTDGRTVSEMLDYPKKPKLFQALVDKIDSVLDKSPRLAESQKRYGELTKEAADKGIVIVIPVGNERKFGESLDIKFKPGGLFNTYAQSEHVIAVGAAKIDHTDRGLDAKVAKFSSPGSDKFKPTVLVQGQDIPVSTGSKTANGTSLSSPQVAGVVALMLEQNPKLKFAEIKAMLQKSSEPIAGAAKELQGAGVLDMASAVIAARDSKTK